MINKKEKFIQGVDNFTPFARGMFAQLRNSHQKRRVLATLCGMGGIGRLTAISNQARLEERRTAVALHKLRQDGFVVLRNHIHSVADKRLVAWYLCSRYNASTDVIEPYLDISWNIEAEKERSRKDLDRLIAEAFQQ